MGNGNNLFSLFHTWQFRLARVHLFSWNHPRLLQVTVMSTSIKYLKSATSALLSCPPDESKMLTSWPIYGYNMAPMAPSWYCWVSALKATCGWRCKDTCSSNPWVQMKTDCIAATRRICEQDIEAGCNFQRSLRKWIYMLSNALIPLFFNAWIKIIRAL